VTGRERLTLAARGGEPDATPVVTFGKGGDAAIVGPNLVSETVDGETAVLARILSPLGRAIKSGSSLVARLHDDVESGAHELEHLANETRSEMLAALANGADGVFYELDGAYPAVTTPMEYGGHFLEVDRRLLSEVEQANFNVLFVCGESEPYIDFVSDLPAHAFAWDPRSGVTAEYVRTMRQGALACEGCEILLDLHAGARS
jgi:hypothetical protein